MPLQATSGAASYDAFSGRAPVVANYIEEVFSTWLYTGNGASGQTITNGIDLSTKGGLTWIKSRNGAVEHYLFDTSRGATNFLFSNATNAQATGATTLTSFTTSGFSLGASNNVNGSGNTYASWTFREQPKFFDVVTFTGNGANRNIAHNLGSVPAMILVKSRSTASGWAVYHRSLASGSYLVLNATDASVSDSTYFTTTAPTSTTFRVGTANNTNANGQTFVAYLFANDAGGFGLTGTDNVISCGSYAGTGAAGNIITLGYEPQWLMIKREDSAQSWTMYDNMRGIVTGGNDPFLMAEDVGAETTATNFISVNATGFSLETLDQQVNSGSGTYIYIAIRRGPMKVPTDATSVFGLNARAGTNANATVTGGQTDDLVIIKNRGAVAAGIFASRLTANRYLESTNTVAENTSALVLQANPWDVMNGVKVGTTSIITNQSGNTFINYLFKRAPSFMDVVCFTGTGANRTVAHNLQAVPELIIFRNRVAGAWDTYSSALANTQYLVLNTAAAAATGATRFNSTTPTSSVFSVGTSSTTNGSGSGIIAFLFSTCAGVSKVGSYTGNGTTQTINCGLTAGARLVLIKSTNSSGGWYFYDTARGMTLLTDPHWVSNTTAAEVATLGSVTTVATGFALDATIFSDINADTTTYIFLAIA